VSTDTSRGRRSSQRRSSRRRARWSDRDGEHMAEGVAMGIIERHLNSIRKALERG
jgi:hypothetical protein